MAELKEKLINAIKSIDLKKLTLFELKLVSEISETVNGLDKKDYAELLADSVNSTCLGYMKEPITLAEVEEI